MGLDPGTRPPGPTALQAGLYPVSHAILEGRAPARPVAPWVSIPGPGRRGRRPGSTRSLTLSWRGGLLHALSRHGSRSRDQAAGDDGPPGRAPARPVPPWVSIQGPGRRGPRPPGRALSGLSRYPGGAGSRTPCAAMALHPGTRPPGTTALQVGLYQVSHAILEGRAPARPVAPWVWIPGPGRHGGRPSRFGWLGFPF